MLLLAAPVEPQAVANPAADRARLAEITGDSTLRAKPRSPRQGLPGSLQRVSWSLLHPEVRLVWNSTLPYSLNDGPLWAGRGANLSASGGLTIEHPYRDAAIRVVLAPTVLYSQNLPFQIRPNTTPGRSSFANPFHGPDASLDLPHRFGDRHLAGLDLGRSAATVEWRRVAAGVTAENEWWGPGIRNALIMSNNAPGIPRYFVRTARPRRSRLGAIEARLASGTLTQSLFFSDSAIENRTFSGVLIQLQPVFDSTLTIGFARVVYAPVGPNASPFTLTLARSFDAIVRWERISAKQRSDQILALFAREVIPRAGLEVYGEFARMDIPLRISEMLVAAHHSAGWTLGMQWAQPRRSGYLRLQSELTYLEQSRVFADRISPDFYSGRASPQGYTQRGQVIGAAIGPGASSQFIALDWLRGSWGGDIGAFVGRIRWDNDALYRHPGTTFFHHDVSVMAGIRGGWRTALTELSGELTIARRYNYLFQNGIASPLGFRTVDVNNLTLSLAATPR